MSGIICHLRLCGVSSFLTEFLGVMSGWDLMKRLAAGHQQVGRVVQRRYLVTMLRDIVGWPAFASWSPVGALIWILYGYVLLLVRS